ncbi:hypothetical protein A3J03_00320 [Candidatus Uhrbacteria bacterium RIFCSPLOWO2_02_FULL_46_25]|nr:MAG: hypothetical protein A3J03_00320 [Candidatus Uhrbacteria bacterium RIFCSPLOWO2_02_FULL_46_25]
MPTAKTKTTTKKAESSAPVRETKSRAVSRSETGADYKSAGPKICKNHTENTSPADQRTLVS